MLKFGFATAIPAILEFPLYSVSQETIVPIRVNAKRALLYLCFSFLVAFLLKFISYSTIIVAFSYVSTCD
jgi:hypothetical protein